MKAISQDTLKSLAEAKAAIKEAEQGLEGTVDRAQQIINEALSVYNAALGSVASIIENVAGEVQSYMDEQSGAWRDGEHGQAYQEWHDALSELSEGFSAGASFDLSAALSKALEEVDEMVSALDDPPALAD